MEALVTAIQVACGLLLLAGLGLSVWIGWMPGGMDAPPKRPLAEVVPITPQAPPLPAEAVRKAA